MATRSGGKSSDSSAAGSKRKPPTAFQIWFEDAWAGWLKHVSLILAAALLFVLYMSDLLNERFVGIILGFGVGIGAIFFAGTPAREHATTQGQKVALYAVCGLWAACSGYALWYGLYPGAPYATLTLSDEGTTSKPLDIPDGGKSIYVKGKLKGGGGDVNATFKIKGESQAGNVTAEGSLTRFTSTGRVGRRGVARNTTEFTERRLYLGRTKGPLTLTMEQKDETLDKDMEVEVLRAPVPPIAIYILSGVVFVLALALDRKLDPKGRTFLGMAAAVSLVFATYFGFEQVSRHAIVRPAIGSLLAAFIGGGIGSWLITAIVKKMTPEKKRRPQRA
jgi:drug/metabolite transporter (DMT)-like permease